MTPREIAENLIYSIFRAQDDRRFGQLQDKIETLIIEHDSAIKALREENGQLRAEAQPEVKP